MFISNCAPDVLPVSSQSTIATVFNAEVSHLKKDYIYHFCESDSCRLDNPRPLDDPAVAMARITLEDDPPLRPPTVRRGGVLQDMAPTDTH